MDHTTVIVMLARQRSGTNALRSVLEAHPSVACLPEVFHPDPSPDNHLAHRFGFFNYLAENVQRREALTSPEARDRLFVDYFGHLRSCSDNAFVVVDVKYTSTHHFDGPWRYLAAEPGLFRLIRRDGLRVLNVRRRNYLRYYVSERKARASRRWHAPDRPPARKLPWYRRPRSRSEPEPTVEIPIPELRRRLALCRADDEIVQRSFGSYPGYLAVEYEDLFPTLDGAPSRAELERLCDWLAIDKAFPSTRPRYRKQAQLPLRDTIANYDEVERALRGTEFEYCLEDERMYRSQPSPAGAT